MSAPPVLPAGPASNPESVTRSRLKEFRDGIHEAIPIFQVSSFLSDCANSLYSRDLISTIVIITAKLTGFSFSADNFDIDARIDMILCSGSHEEDMFGDSPSIDQFRKACLLAFYEFHQFPGQQAWMRITKLTRTALWIGLDRLESHRARYPGWGIMSEQELDDWGLVWWCIYRLDSYANLSSGTPYLVDECLIDTCLAQDASAASLAEDLRPRSLQRNFLPAHPSGLRETITSIALDSPRTALFNFHIVTITALRLVGRSAQLFRRRPLQGPGYLADIERHLATVRLSLPANYLNTRRNAFSNEAGCDHHARLITLFHLYMTRLFLNIMNCSVGKEGDQWVVHWQEVLESCQDMASISEQWNSSHNLQVDPAISFTIFTALVFLDIHKKSSSALAFGTHSAMGHYETVLHKHLEQFATTWMLPKLLTRMYTRMPEPRLKWAKRLTWMYVRQLLCKVFERLLPAHSHTSTFSTFAAGLRRRSPPDGSNFSRLRRQSWSRSSIIACKSISQGDRRPGALDLEKP